MKLPEKLAKRNLLEYAEGIGGKDMYLSMLHALHDANLTEKSDFNRKQLRRILTKLTESGDFNIDKERIAKLLSERERRRQAYVRMAIESEIDEESGVQPLYGGLQAGGGRYDFRQATHGSRGATGIGAVSSVSHVADKKTGAVLSNSVRSALRPKSSSLAEEKPRTSISRFGR